MTSAEKRAAIAAALTTDNVLLIMKGAIIRALPDLEDARIDMIFTGLNLGEPE